jgi:hypothetical protein
MMREPRAAPAVDRRSLLFDEATLLIGERTSFSTYFTGAASAT